mmetsp:Transcript_24196/g.21290  ORF Transcript_24196/g.21290 Transcript_24196/m.21290 type:complete len:251 (+) Transcript_24196:292-1044(+)
MNDGTTPIAIATQPVYDDTELGATTFVTVQVKNSVALETTDYYLIKFPEPSQDMESSADVIGSYNVIYLPRNKIIALNPTATVGAGAADIDLDVINPDYVLTTGEMAFSATVSHYSAFGTYSVPYPAAAQFSGLTTGMTLSTETMSSTFTRDTETTLNIVFQGPYENMVFVAIDVGAELTLGDDCYQGPTSTIPMLECEIDAANNRLLVTLEDQTYPATNEDLDIIVTGITNANAAGGVSDYDFYGYSTV